MYFCCHFPFDLPISTVSGLRCLVTSFINFLISVFSWGGAQQGKLKEVWCKRGTHPLHFSGIGHLAKEQLFCIILISPSSSFYSRQKGWAVSSDTPASTTALKGSRRSDFLFWFPCFPCFCWYTKVSEPFLVTTPTASYSSIFCFFIWGFAVEWVKQGFGRASREAPGMVEPFQTRSTFKQLWCSITVTENHTIKWNRC